MAFSRGKYDERQYEQQLERSVGVGNYYFFYPRNESNDRCYSFTGPVGSKSDSGVPMNKGQIEFGKKAEIEGHLMNRVIPISDDNSRGKHDEYRQFEGEVNHMNNCSENRDTLDSRFSHPLSQYRGMETTSYKFNPHLHVNPQAQFHTWRLGTTTRLVAKDSVKKVVIKSGSEKDNIKPTGLSKVNFETEEKKDNNTCGCNN